MQLVTDNHRNQLLENGRRRAVGENLDPFPVLKLFTPDAQATWLLTELDPSDPDIAFGLCDLGFGSPELGTVRISELERLRGPLGLPIEVDEAFQPRMALSAYAWDAYRRGATRT